MGKKQSEFEGKKKKFPKRSNRRSGKKLSLGG